MPLPPPPFQFTTGFAGAEDAGNGLPLESTVRATKKAPLNWPPPPPETETVPWPMTNTMPLKLTRPFRFKLPVTSRMPAPDVPPPKLRSPFTTVICGLASVPRFTLEVGPVMVWLAKLEMRLATLLMPPTVDQVESNPAVVEFRFSTSGLLDPLPV